MYVKYPPAVKRFTSLFPNNLLFANDIKEDETSHILNENFLDVLNSESSTERTIINFIKDNQAYFIIASILQYYSFGHHETYIFPEFQLGTSYKVDYLIVGKGSGGYEFVFIELEHPNRNIVLKAGHEGEAFRKGIQQIHDWKFWLNASFHSLHETFRKYKNPQKDLPEEFLITDPSRWQFVVVAGRRSDFSEKMYTKARDVKQNGILLLHYDNLYDKTKDILKHGSF
ncbi:DUF4263 domain-containing protein [Ectobacillus antri]|uniref:DUF4263 domain-containing protein n=1 Tax=Ectobacillus antri TaxID=2486280 RepID=A0ABT6H085_9BACI|nr:Shedu anti-phage system protein SduA domain-containing protein [Ectobacillus antri]MDG4655873.1 DUF4263 domain-containing protein [Ectobacillus antri]MDG5752548.1 DUF4263 domain-containing protein [Ectobacillus antri]